MSEKDLTSGRTQEEIRRLLASTSVITGACELDLLVFLHRHPYTLLTNEQLATFVGYDMKQIAKAIDAFIENSLLERTQNPTHSARLYCLRLEEPSRGGFKALLDLASTRQGRQSVLQVMGSQPTNPTRLTSAPKLRSIA